MHNTNDKLYSVQQFIVKCPNYEIVSNWSEVCNVQVIFFTKSNIWTFVCSTTQWYRDCVHIMTSSFIFIGWSSSMNQYHTKLKFYCLVLSSQCRKELRWNYEICISFFDEKKIIQLYRRTSKRVNDSRPHWASARAVRPIDVRAIHISFVSNIPSRLWMHAAGRKLYQIVQSSILNIAWTDPSLSCHLYIICVCGSFAPLISKQKKICIHCGRELLVFWYWYLQSHPQWQMST